MRSRLREGSLLIPPVGRLARGQIRRLTASSPASSLQIQASDSLVILDPSAESFAVQLADASIASNDVTIMLAGPTANVVELVPVPGQVIEVPGIGPLGTLSLGSSPTGAPRTSVRLSPDGANWNVAGGDANIKSRIDYGDFADMPAPTLDGALYVAIDLDPKTLFHVENGVQAPLAILPDSPIMTALPTIAGTLSVGQRLTASPGTWVATPAPTFAYQWLRDGLAITVGGVPATDQTYTVQTADLGHSLTVQVTATNSHGSGQAQSAPATISGTGTHTIAQPIPLLLPGGGSSGALQVVGGISYYPSKFIFAGGVAAPASPAAAVAAGSYLSFPAVALPQVTDIPGFRLIVHNGSKQTIIQPVLVNADGSLFAGNGGNLPRVEPGNVYSVGGTSRGRLNMTVPGVPSAGMKLVFQNLVATEAGGFSVGALAWMV